LTQVQVGLIAVWIGGSVLPILLVLVIERAIRQRRRLQWSLAWLLGMVLGTAVVLLGGLHWYYSEQAFAQAQSEYEAAVARFKSSYKCEKPAHGVTLTKPYYIGKYEITQEQYQSIMGNNPSSFKGRDLPVEQVSWNDAQEFCKKVSEKTGSVARLPTEAEWERACRAGTKTTYYTGDSDADLDRAGWYDKNSKKTTHPVGQKTPNAWGVYDMHGNVLEWCADWFEAYKCDSTVDPQCTAQEQGRVSRGGSRIGGPGGCRSANRGGIDPDGCGNILGFRVMVAVPRTPQ
jgi:formylglycine-generating enzyme required for sulfatase activity